MKYVNRSFTLPAGPGNVTDIEWKIAMGQAITKDEARKQYEKEYDAHEFSMALMFPGWLRYRQIKLKEDTQ